MNTNYCRVIPRDLFNEAKLMKCIGRLTLLIHDRTTPPPMSFDHDDEAFMVALLDDGSLIITNIRICIKDVEYIFKTTYNSKSAYPLFLEHDYTEYRVFNEEGEFDDEFISFCNGL